MKRFQLALAALWLSGIAGLAASSLGNIPISQMSIATNLLPTAWIPIIQPLPGRTTNDNFRVSPAAFQQYMLTNVDVLWNNLAATYRPTHLQGALNATNITSYGALMSAGALVPYGNFLVNLATGTNDINPFNASIARLNAPTAVASDTTVRLGIGNGFGQLFWLHNYADTAFTLHNGDTLFDAPLLHVILPNGDWTPSHRGDALALFQTEAGWEEAYRTFNNTNVVASGLWASDGTYLYPVTNSWFTMLPPPGLIVDTNSLTWYGTPGLNDGIALLSLGPNTGGAFKTLDVGVFDPTADNNESDLRYTAGPNISTLQLFANLGSTNYRSAGWSAGIPAYWFFTDTVDGISTNLFFYDPANVQGVATWRLGGYTNGDLPMLEIFNGDVDSGLPRFQFWNTGLAIGPNARSIWTAPLTNGTSLVAHNQPSLGDPNYNEFWIGVGESLSLGSSLDVYGNTNAYSWIVQTQYGLTNGSIAMQTGWNPGEPSVANISLQLDGTARFLVAPYLGSTTADQIATNAPYVFDTSTLVTNMTALVRVKHLGTNMLTFGPGAQMNFGEGGTNVLYRSGNDIAYTNGATEVYLQFAGGGSADRARFGVVSGHPDILAASGQSIFLRPNNGASGDIVATSTALVPDVDKHFDLGGTGSTSAWKDSYFKGEQHAIGTNDGAGNWSWMRVFVTNGVAVLDLANQGTGPAPTRISFRTNGVEVGHFP